MTGRQTTRPWVSKMAGRRHHVPAISRQFRGPIYWNAHASRSFEHAHREYNSVSKRIRRCSMDGRKRYENYKCGRKSFWKRSKTAPFSFETGLVWTGPKSSQNNLRGLSKARFRRRTSHEPNRMQMRENKGFCSFAFDSAHVKYGVWTLPKLTYSVTVNSSGSLAYSYRHG